MIKAFQVCAPIWNYASPLAPFSNC